MKGLIELFKEFHSLAVEGKYPASARAFILLGARIGRFGRFKQNDPTRKHKVFE